ncbi:MAG: pectin acetylesterase-family hydrolase [Myxococcales bacterium]|nr:pectin acetylesterase-family hydrolase [Myxococcales bacterium]
MRVFVLFLSLFSLFLTTACGTRARCRPDTCTGCCTQDDQCVAGTSNVQCGNGGNSCDVCVGAQVCGVGGRCETSTFMMTMDAGTAQDAGVTVMDGGTQGTAITAPNEVWTWVDFPGSACGNGSPTGIGVNLSNRSSDVIVYMQGGGACWNQLTCYTVRSASDFDGYGSAKFANDSIKNQVAFNRTNMNNPFRDASFVFIPYCTGDVHSGDTVASYGGHHKGAANVRAFLARLGPTFPGARRIWLTGTSAGGFGVQLNYHRFAETFPQAEVHGLADSAQMINPTQASLLAEWLDAWGVSDPPGCTGCTQNFNLVPSWLARTYPNRRFGLLAFSRDSVLAPFFSLAQPDFEMATTKLLTEQYQGKSNLKYYVVDPATPTHVMLNQLFTRSVGGVTLSSWAQKWANGEAGWENVRGM